MKNVIEATLLNGKFGKDNVLSPRVRMSFTVTPIQFKRLQFPICLAFAMIINKSREQTMIICPIERPRYSHGKLHVACSRVRKPSNIFINIPDGLTRNIVNYLA